MRRFKAVLGITKPLGPTDLIEAGNLDKTALMTSKRTNKPVGIL